MNYSHQARQIKPSATLSLNEKARELREIGVPVIHLGIGEPKNKAPIAAILNSVGKLRAGDIKYTPTDGTPSLKKAIIRYTEEYYERIVDPENIIVTNGAKQSLYNIIYSIINPQDEVILLAPYWVSYPEMIKMAYGIPVVVTPENGTFHHRIEEIERAISSYTKIIILNSPNNPSGVMYSEEFIRDIVELCESKGIYLIMDDIYHRLIFSGRKWVPGYKFTNRDVDNSHIIVVNGVSKLYGMTGFRIGWVIAPKKLVEIMINIQANTTSCPSVVLQAAAEGALTGQQGVVENLRMTIENNKNVFLSEMKAINDVYLFPPDGTFYSLPDFRAYSKDSVKLAKFLLEKTFVVTVPGVDFGMEGHLRISYAGSIKDVTEGISRIRWALDPESPNEIYIGDRKYIRDWM